MPIDIQSYFKCVPCHFEFAQLAASSTCVSLVEFSVRAIAAHCSPPLPRATRRPPYRNTSEVSVTCTLTLLTDEWVRRRNGRTRWHRDGRPQRQLRGSAVSPSPSPSARLPTAASAGARLSLGAHRTVCGTASCIAGCAGKSEGGRTQVARATRRAAQPSPQPPWPSPHGSRRTLHAAAHRSSFNCYACHCLVCDRQLPPH